MCLGVVPNNENKIDEMTSILRELQQQYVPLHGSSKPIGIALGRDQLTAERARTCQDQRKHSFSP